MKRYIRANLMEKGSAGAANKRKGIYKLDSTTEVPLKFGAHFHCFSKVLFDTTQKDVSVAISIYVTPPKGFTRGGPYGLNAYTEDEFIDLYNDLMSCNTPEELASMLNAVKDGKNLGA